LKVISKRKEKEAKSIESLERRNEYEKRRKKRKEQKRRKEEKEAKGEKQNIAVHKFIYRKLCQKRV
jgi:hypothetical protein